MIYLFTAMERGADHFSFVLQAKLTIKLCFFSFCSYDNQLPDYYAKGAFLTGYEKKCLFTFEPSIYIGYMQFGISVEACFN